MAARRFLGLGSAIKIYNPHHNSMNIYATVIHELAHASHCNMGAWDYNKTSKIVKESWASGVEWALTRMVYPTYQPNYNRLRYTGIVQDMIDKEKLVASRYVWTGNAPYFQRYSIKTYNDQVSGYTIRQLEDALEDERTWDGWKINIIESYDNEKKENLHEGFTFWSMQ